MSAWQGSLNNPNSERAKAKGNGRTAPNGKHHEPPKSSAYDSLAIALDLAATGLPVFPCTGQKVPAIAKAKGGNGFRDASTDPERIRELWRLAGRNAQLIGVPTGPASGRDILDIDPRHNGDAWETENRARLGETRMHGTPSTGRHYVFHHVEGVRNSASKRSLAPGVDVRGEGGYACWPPSAGYSVIHEAEVADWPDWLLPLVLKAAEPPPRPVASDYTAPAEISDKRLQGYIRSALDRVGAAPDGQKHNTLRDAAIQIGGVADRAGLSDTEAVQLLLAALPGTVKDWDNARRTAAWGLAEGRKRPIELPDRDQFASRRRQAGDGSPPPPPPPRPPEADPRPEPPPEPDDPVEAMVAQFNARYLVLNENGKACIYAPRHDPILNRRFFDRMSFEDLEKLYLNRFIVVGKDKDGSSIRRRVAPLWLSHSDRRQYIGGVVFDPARRNGPDVLNLWEGFAVKPRAGSWAKLHDHIRDVICDRDPVVFAYLLDWMADLVQRPACQGEVAVVLRGPEGCGKGTLAKALKYLLGQHGLAISNARHLTGNFNGHLRDVVFLFADEAFYAGDRAHIGVLKALVTEPYLTIEGKYQAAYQSPNFLHVMMASNEDWVVPASLNSRRWLVLDVPRDRIGDHAYFAAIYEELEHGGHSAMLHDLLNRDISKSNLRAVPVTDALQTQRKRSVDTITGWWLECLHRGYVFESKLGLEDHWGQWHDFVPTEVLFASYTRYCRDQHERHPLSRELFGKWIASTGANPGRMRNQAIGEHMVDAITDGRSSRIAELIMHPFPYGYSIGALDDARLSFSAFSGLDIEWE